MPVVVFVGGCGVEGVSGVVVTGVPVSAVSIGVCVSVVSGWFGVTGVSVVVTTVSPVLAELEGSTGACVFGGVSGVPTSLVSAVATVPFAGVVCGSEVDVEFVPSAPQPSNRKPSVINAPGFSPFIPAIRSRAKCKVSVSTGPP